MTADDVSDAELRTDIGNTKKEMKAFLHLSTGYLLLSELPENSSRAREYIFEFNKYSRLHDECGTFLRKLLKIAEERNLILI